MLRPKPVETVRQKSSIQKQPNKISIVNQRNFALR